MSSRVSFYLYLLIFFGLVGFGPALLLSILLDGGVHFGIWLLIAVLELLAGSLFNWFIVRPFRQIAQAMYRSVLEETEQVGPAFSRFAPAEAHKMAVALSELARRRTEAKQALEERVVERTAELAFSRDLLFKQNVELETLNEAMVFRSQENQQLLVETLYRSRELAVLNEMSSDALAARSLNDLNHRALDLATKLLEAPVGLVGLLAERGEKWYASEEVLPDLGKIQEQSWPVGQASLLLTQTVLADGIPLAIADSQLDEHPAHSLMQMTGLRSAVFLPLHSPEDKRPLGVLVLGDRKPRRWRPDEVELMTTVTNHLALSTSYARLVDEIATDRNRFDAVLNGVSEGVVLVNENNQVLFANPAAFRNMSVSSEAILATYDAERFLLVPGTKSQELAALLARGEKVDPVQVERNGRTWSVSINPIHDHLGQFIGVAQVQRDVTEAARVDRMKTEFVSLVSHELRTPLTSIKGYLELVLDGDTGPINEIQHRFLETARNSTDRLVNLINDLLDVSRIESGRVELEPGLLYINKAINNVIEPMRLSAEEHELELRVRLTPGIPPAWADTDRVTQIMTNLLSNAMKYTKPGGQIEMTARQSVDRRFIEIEVSDTGLGMNEEEQKQLFNKFFRSSNPSVRSISGTGLGLAITKALVEMHGGQIWVRSVLSQGSTFGFSLPLAQLDQVEFWSEQADFGLAEANSKIMLLDANRDVAESLRDYLEAEGHVVSIALDGEEAVRRTASEQPELIVLLFEAASDSALLNRLKFDQRSHRTPLLFLSFSRSENKICQIKALAHFTEPVPESRLIECLDALLGYPPTAMNSDEPEHRLVLVAHPDPKIRAGLDQSLKKAGYATLLAQDGSQALSLSQRHLPDLALLDLGLPVQDGLAVLSSLRAEPLTAGIPVLLFVAQPATDSGQPTLLTPGTIELLNQSLSTQELAARLSRYLPVPVSYE